MIVLKLIYVNYFKNVRLLKYLNILKEGFVFPNNSTIRLVHAISCEILFYHREALSCMCHYMLLPGTTEKSGMESLAHHQFNILLQVKNFHKFIRSKIIKTGTTRILVTVSIIFADTQVILTISAHSKGGGCKVYNVHQTMER